MPTPVRYLKGFKVQFLHKGIRYRKRWTFDEWSDPQGQAQAFIDAILHGQTGPITLIPDAISRYLFYSEKIKRKAYVTLTNDTTRLRNFARYCVESKISRVDQLNILLMRKFQEWYFLNAPFSDRPHHRRRRSDPNSTWEKYRQIVSAFCAWAVKEGLLQTNPAADPALKTKAKSLVPVIYTIDELAALFEHFDSLDSSRPVPYLGAVFRFFAYTGCRFGEMFNCRWPQIDFPHNAIRFVNTKTGIDRTVPMSAKLRPYLERLPRKTTYVFDNGIGAPLYHESAYWKMLETALKAIEAAPALGPRNLYTFRHTFAANLCMAGVPITTVKELMGHSNIQTTMRYALHFSVGHKEDSIARLPY